MNLENETPDDLSGDALAVLDEMDTEAPAEPEADAPEDIEAEESDPDGDEPEQADAQSDEASGDDDQPKGKSRTQKRIDQLTREKNDARREADYHRQQLQDVQTQFDQLQRQVQTMQPTQQQVEMGAHQGLNPQQVQDLIRQEATQQVEAERFNATVTAVRKILEDNGAGDALQRLSNGALTRFEPEAVTALSEAKFPARVANAITQNEEVFQKFSSLPNGVARARFIDRLDGRLESRQTAKPKTEAKPTPRVRGAAKKPEKSPDDMSQAEFEAWSRKQGWLE
ncbi:MAG: hypothetical protein AAFO74_13005 [Pseudomonadota bacterium]